jgi:hypothetical protein
VLPIRLEIEPGAALHGFAYFYEQIDAELQLNFVSEDATVRRSIRVVQSGIALEELVRDSPSIRVVEIAVVDVTEAKVGTSGKNDEIA